MVSLARGGVGHPQRRRLSRVALHPPAVDEDLVLVADQLDRCAVGDATAVTVNTAVVGALHDASFSVVNPMYHPPSTKPGVPSAAMKGLVLIGEIAGWVAVASGDDTERLAEGAAPE